MVALVLAERGFDVAVNYRRSRAAAETLAAEIEGMGRRSAALQADVADREAAEGLVARTASLFGRLDVLVHAAGPFVWKRTTAATTPDEWREMVDGNLSSCYYTVRAALPHMRRRRWGRVDTFGFAGAVAAVGSPDMAAYAAAKVGLVSLTRSLAREEAAHGITVNMVCPGIIDDPWKERRIADARAAAATAPEGGSGRGAGDRGAGNGEETGFLAPVGRTGTGEDVARVIAFLCEEESDFLTGNVIDVSGGVHLLTV
ncbi:MAG: SDR family oxidoreductase [Clostridia bacterium]|nr:SDR family oxidoreductase [Clostridia bacterium]